MGYCTNIGIYIGADDKDIAAWFNLLQRNGMSRSKWVHGLLAAYALGKQIQIGIVDRRAPLIRDGPHPGDTVSSKGSFRYGWHVRGPNREYVIGSVVNLSVQNSEIKSVLDEAWANGHKLAPFIKSLIRSNLKIGEKEVPPKPDTLKRIWSEYLVSINSKMTAKKKAQTLQSPESEDPSEANNYGTDPTKLIQKDGNAPPSVAAEERPKSDISPQLQSPDNAPIPEKINSPLRADPDRMFHFQEADEPESQPPERQKNQHLGRNPLLSQI